MTSEMTEKMVWIGEIVPMSLLKRSITSPALVMPEMVDWKLIHTPM